MSSGITETRREKELHKVPFIGFDIANTYTARAQLAVFGADIEEAEDSSPPNGTFSISLTHTNAGIITWLTIEKWEIGRTFFGATVRWRLHVSIRTITDDSNYDIILDGYLVGKKQKQLWSHFVSGYDAMMEGEAVLFDERASLAALNNG